MTSTAETSPRPLPPPRRDLLLRAARDLGDLEWEIVRSADDARKVEVRGPALADLELQPLPPSGGTLKNFAQTLVVQAAFRIAEHIQGAHLDAWERAAPASLGVLERERAVLDCARGHVCRQVEALAEHGEQVEGGGWAEGYDALMRLAAEHRSSILSPGAPQAIAQLVENSARPAPSSKPLTSTKRPNLPLKRVAFPSDERELRKALKYVFSTGMGASIVIISAAPLRLAVVPASTFQGRFDATLSGKGARAVKDRAQTVMLRAAQRIVEEGLTVETLRTWLPSVAWDRLDEQEVAQHAVELLTKEVQRRLNAALTERGADWFKRYAEGDA